MITGTDREQVVRSVAFEGPDRVPLMHAILPAAWHRHGDELYQIVRDVSPAAGRRSPAANLVSPAANLVSTAANLVSPAANLVSTAANLVSTASRYDYDPGLARYAIEDDFVFLQPRHFMFGPVEGSGYQRDEWGCVWQKASPGTSGVVVTSPLADWGEIEHYRWPDGGAYWRFDQPYVEETVQAAREHGKYVLAYAGNLFEMLQCLRGYEPLMIDCVRFPDRVQLMAEWVTAYNLQTIETWSQFGVDGIFIEDDWGTQEQLMISPRLWRTLFRSRYAQLFDAVHAHGLRVFFHSDGYILPIIPDLIELGCDVLNPQFSCHNLEELAALTGGKLCILSDLDRQFVLPRGTPQEVRDYVQRVFELFASPAGGLIFRGQVNADCPLENVAAMYEAYQAHALR